MPPPLLISLGCFVVSLVATAIVRSYALRHSVLDRPNSRSSHDTPIPRGGGVGFLVATMCGLAAAAVLGLAPIREIETFAAGLAALGGIGWLDDIRTVSARVRLFVQIAVAAWTVIMLGGLPLLRTGETSLAIGAFGYAIGIVGIVWSINLFNFMDGIDGIAGSQAVLIFGSVSLMLFMRGSSSLAAIAGILAMSSAGFLVWNWPPAKIFLGDVGSGAIGFAVAALGIASENRDAVPLIDFAIIGGVFVVDATITLLRRLARGGHPAVAHRDHAYQRLARAVNSHRTVTVAAAALTVLLAVVAIETMRNPATLTTALVLSYAFLVLLFVAVERRAPV